MDRDRVRKRLYIFFTLLLIGGVALILSQAKNSRIVVAVGSQTLTQGEFNTYNNAFNRYREVAKSSGNTAGILLNAKELSNEDITRTSLEELIRHLIVRDALSRKYGKTLTQEIEREIGQAISSSNSKKLADATYNLYGLNLNEFRQFILQPQAELIVAERYIKKENGDYNIWLNETLQNAVVTINIYPYIWKNGTPVHK